MKTSNKLLIAFALTLILVPLLGMVFVSRVYYKEGTRNYDEVATIKSFDTPTKNLTNLPTAAFQQVSLMDGTGMRLSIYLIKDAKFGAKISNHLKDRIQISVDANGQLQVTVKKSTDEKRRNDYGTIYLFSPNVTAINLNKAEEVTLYAQQDSLQVSATNVTDLNFSEGTNLKQFKINANLVTLVRFSGAKIPSLAINLERSNLETEESSFDALSITTKNKANIDILGNQEKADVFEIKNLVINTVDSAKVNIAGIKVGNCSGKFSDQTRVEMPAKNLNQMYFIKK